VDRNQEIKKDDIARPKKGKKSRATYKENETSHHCKQGSLATRGKGGTVLTVRLGPGGFRRITPVVSVCASRAGK